MITSTSQGLSVTSQSQSSNTQSNDGGFKLKLNGNSLPQQRPSDRTALSLESQQSEAGSRSLNANFLGGLAANFGGSPESANAAPISAKPGIQNTLQQGSRGAEVKELQKMLNAKSGGKLDVDGIFGPKTLAAVKRMRKGFELNGDGIVGEKTLGKLQQPEMLKLGARGQDVSDLQKSLNAKTGAKLDVDGIFGPKTLEAVKQMQKGSNIDVDGVVGPQTSEKLQAGTQANGSTNSQPAAAGTKPAEPTQRTTEAGATKPAEATQKPAEAGQTKPAEAAQKPAEAGAKPVEATQKPAEGKTADVSAAGAKALDGAVKAAEATIGTPYSTENNCVTMVQDYIKRFGGTTGGLTDNHDLLANKGANMAAIGGFEVENGKLKPMEGFGKDHNKTERGMVFGIGEPWTGSKVPVADSPDGTQWTKRVSNSHSGIVSDVKRDEQGNVTDFSFYHTSGTIKGGDYSGKGMTKVDSYAAWASDKKERFQHAFVHAPKSVLEPGTANLAGSGTTNQQAAPSPSGPSPAELPSVRPEGSVAAFAFDKEARTDRNGSPVVYNPPSSDANRSEVAGFGNNTSPEKYEKLVDLVKSGQGQEARSLAESYLAERAQPFVGGVQDFNTASVLTGLVHHRGEGGVKSIANKLGIQADSPAQLGRSIETQASTDQNFPDRWVEARALQERENERAVWKSLGQPGTLEEFRTQRARQLGGTQEVEELGGFGKGLVNRWREEAQLFANSSADLLASR
jgi:peptidoglycan hydrolase-like protein with peptidoglycan-binding domain